MRYDPEEECDKLVQKIESLCRMRGMSIHAAAGKAGLSSSALNELLKGKTRPHVYTLFKLCNALEITIQELFTTHSGALQDSSGEAEEELLVCYRQLPEWKKELLICYADMLEKYNRLELTEKREK